MLRTVSYLSLTTALTVGSAAMAQDQWTGPYIGIVTGGIMPDFENNAGGWGYDELIYGSANEACEATEGQPGCYLPLNDLNDLGAFAGFRIGYDRQLSSGLVVGGSADFGLAMLSNVTYYNGFDGEPTNSERAELRVNALASVRARLGLAIDDLLLYGTGGVTFVSADFAVSTSDTDPRMGVLSLSKLAPTLGLGAEYLVGDNVSISGAVNHTFLSTSIDGISQGDFDTASNISFNGITTFELGLNYRF